MDWLIEERDELVKAAQKSLGMLSGVQWLLRNARNEPAQPSLSDEDLANMLELVKDQLGATDVPSTTSLP